jgi:hypothetical protein
MLDDQLANANRKRFSDRPRSPLGSLINVNDFYTSKRCADPAQDLGFELPNTRCSDRHGHPAIRHRVADQLGDVGVGDVKDGPDLCVRAPHLEVKKARAVRECRLVAADAGDSLGVLARSSKAHRASLPWRGTSGNISLH